MIPSLRAKAKQSSFARAGKAGLLTWGWDVSRRLVSSLFDCRPALRPDRGSVKMARAEQVKADPLGSPRSGLALTWSSTPSGCCGRASAGRISPLVSDPRFEPVWQSGFACQIKLTFGRRAGRTAPTFRLRRAGSRGRGHSSLRHLKPCNPSVRPPGSAEADRASADGSFFCGEKL